MIGNITRKSIAFLLAAAVVFTAFFAVMTDTACAASKPAQVKGVKAVAKSASSIRITWKKSKNAKKYQVYQATSKSGKYKKIATVSKRNYTKAKLKAGKKYYYKVRGINGKKKGSFSKIVSAKTKAKSAKEQVVVDKNARTVTITVKVNDRKKTGHLGIDAQTVFNSEKGVTEPGFNSGKGVFDAYCTPTDFYNGLKQAGGISWAGDSKINEIGTGVKISKKNAVNSNFTHMDVELSWNGETHPLSEIFSTENNKNSPPDFDIVFSSNAKTAESIHSGCILCLDSCYVGITSNMCYGLCYFDDAEHQLYVRRDILPAAGTYINVTFRLK